MRPLLLLAGPQMIALCTAHQLPVAAIEVLGGGVMEWTMHRLVDVYSRVARGVQPCLVIIALALLSYI